MRSQKPGRPTSRRALLQAVGGGSVAAALAACGADQQLGAAQPPREPTVVMIIRHAEKPGINNSNPYGVDIDGNTDDHSLTPLGWTRAGALTQLFGSTHSPPPRGLLRPVRFYASQGDTKSRRPMQTLSPLAAKLGQYVITKYSRDDVPALAAEMKSVGGVNLVAWESDALPTIPPALGKVTPAPPTIWPNDRFDMVWVLTSEGDGWRFAQIPQLLLSGDRPEMIV